MDPIIIIPARYGSTRLPGKALHYIAGRMLIEHTVNAARRTGLRIFVATDDDRIAAAAGAVGCDFVMTGECENGTERCAEAAWLLHHNGPVINWQGDSPLVPAEWIPGLLAALEEGVSVATPVQLCSSDHARWIRDDFAAGKPGATTTAISHDFRALYFSKAPVPSRGPYWLHIGIYAYTAAALRAYGRGQTPLEQSEQLEQLRFLERGIQIGCVAVNGPPIWEVNNFHDIRIVERMMEERDVSVRR